MKNTTIMKNISDECIKKGEALTNTQWDTTAQHKLKFYTAS